MSALLLHKVLQCMHNLEDARIKAYVNACKDLLLMLDALEAAGTSHSCKELSILASCAAYEPHESKMVCSISCYIVYFDPLAQGLFPC